MRWKTGLLILAVALTVAACGGGNGSTPAYGSGSGSSTTSGSGSGGTSGSTSSSPSISVALYDASNQQTLFTQSTQSYTLKVTLLDASGQAVPNTLVTVTGADFTLNPSNGKILTSSGGVASISVKQTDPSASSATQICASATVGSSTSSLSNCLSLQMGAVSAKLGTLSASASSVNAYQSVQLTVPVTLTGSSSPAVGVPVNFSTTCGSVSPATANTNTSGIATASYTNSNSGVACSGTVTLTASTQTGNVTANVTANAAVASNILFESATPSRIYLKGSPGAGSSIVKFKLLDQNGNAIPGQILLVSFVQQPTGATLQGGAALPLEATTDNNGEIPVSVQSGTAPGPLQLKAQLKTDATVFNVSNGLTVASGLPTQKAFSLSASVLNVEGWDYDGVQSVLYVNLADRLGNPVPDNTTVNFISSGGQVVASCLTTGASTNNVSACSAVFSSQNPRPASGRVQVLAWAQGEKSFIDNSVPSNNVFDAGTDTPLDQGQPFLDANDNGVYDFGETTIGPVNGSQSCPAFDRSNGVPKSVPNTCTGTWGATLVNEDIVIVLSGSTPNPSALSTSRSALSAGSCSYSFTLADARGNQLPAGTKLSVPNATGLTFTGFGGQGDTVPNTDTPGGTVHIAYFSGCAGPGSEAFTLNVKTPKNISTSLLLP